MSGLREALKLQEDPQWPSNEALHTEEARQYFLRLVCMPAKLMPLRYSCANRALDLLPLRRQLILLAAAYVAACWALAEAQ